jgi:PKD repeat protein
MRKLFTILLLSVFSMSLLTATPVSKETAKKVATNFYTNYAPSSTKDFSIKESFASIEKGTTTYYTFVFNAGGFVMVAADDAVTPILGYSTISEFHQEIESPVIQQWFADYNNQITQIIDQKIDNKTTLPKWKSILNKEFAQRNKSVTPLIASMWGQSGGWDDYVPAGTPVGCVATAASMVMKYHEYPTTGQGWHTYVHPTYGEQSANFFETTYDWSNMPNNYGTDASAILSYHVGVAVDMNYGPSGSGAFTKDLTYVLANYFKYDQSINFAELENYTDTEWKDLLKSELDVARPMVYSGSGSSGGHAFICDGYDENDLFHFNWGWSGSQNGYFAIGSLNTSNGDFNATNGVVYNIKPAATGEEQMLWTSSYSNFPAESTYPGYIDAVDENVAWAIGRDGSGNNGDFKVYTRTKDGGATWEGESLNYGTAFSMICGLDANIAYIAAYGTGTGNKIIRTTNGGIDWEPVLSGAGASSFFNVVHFFNENDGFVQGDPEGGEYELYTTTDGGDTWSRVDGANIPNPEDASEYGIVGHYDAIGDNIWYTTNNGYIYKSTDKGYTWTKHLVANGTETNISIAFAEDGLVGLANYFNGTDTDKYKTTDGGETWTPLTATGNFYDAGISYVPGTTATFVSVGSDYETPFMGVSYSKDGGETWSEYAEYYTNFQMTGLDMVSETKGFAGNFSGEFAGGMWVLGAPALVGGEFSADNTSTCLGESVTFTNESYGTYDSILWNFGEGAAPATSTEINPGAVSYSTEGSKDVSITLYSNGGEFVETKYDYIKVYNAPTADFTYEPYATSLWYFITFTSTSTNTYGNESQFDWTWGDGNQASDVGETPSYMYAQESTTYNVTLTVTNATCSDDITKEVTVTDPNGIESTNDFTFNAYPNPTNGELTITNIENSTIYIYAMNGQMIESTKTTSNSIKLNLDNYQSGVYAVKVVNNKGVAVKYITVK